MLTRREFLYTTAIAGAVSQVAHPAAARYDLLIKGGRVIDPAQRIDRVADVAIQAGRIAAVQPNLAASDAAELIDARGRIVVPGLVDIHAHLSEDVAPFCLSMGSTSLVDAGTKGADGVMEAVALAKSAPNRVRIFVNISRLGVTTDGDLIKLENADVAAARRAVQEHRDLVVGIKARLSRNVAGANDLEALRRAQAVASEFKLPVMIHIGDSMSPLTAILALLKPGDIVTHVYAPDNGILDAQGRVLPQVHEARRRGIFFDIGNGRNAHIVWDVAEKALAQDFPPHTISSDLTQASRTDKVFDFPTVLSKFLLLGMPLDRVIACATVNAARVIPGFKELGTLKPGAAADVAVFEVREGQFEFVDNNNAKRVGPRKLMPQAVVMNGRRAKA